MEAYSQAKAAIFDLDGLMLNTERPFIEEFRRLAALEGLDVPFDVLTRIIGIDCYASDRLLRSIYGDDFPFFRLRDIVHKEEELRGEAEGIEQMPGLMILLQTLRIKNIPMAVATSTLRERAEWKLRCGGISDFFNVTVCGDEIQNGKPAPDIFLQAAQKLKIAPLDCIGFEDSPAGLKALAAAGIRSIFIKDTIEPDSETLAGVWKRLNSLDEAINFF